MSSAKCLCVSREKSFRKEKRERERGNDSISIFFGMMIFDYVESRFTGNRFCSKEAATTFTNGPYFPHAAFLPSPLQQTRLAIKHDISHESKLWYIFNCKERFLWEKFNRQFHLINRSGLQKDFGKKDSFPPMARVRVCVHLCVFVWCVMHVRIIYKDKGQRSM